MTLGKGNSVQIWGAFWGLCWISAGRTKYYALDIQTFQSVDWELLADMTVTSPFWRSGTCPATNSWRLPPPATLARMSSPPASQIGDCWEQLLGSLLCFSRCCYWSSLHFRSNLGNMSHDVLNRCLNRNLVLSLAAHVVLWEDFQFSCSLHSWQQAFCWVPLLLHPLLQQCLFWILSSIQIIYMQKNEI